MITNLLRSRGISGDEVGCQRKHLSPDSGEVLVGGMLRLHLTKRFLFDGLTHGDFVKRVRGRFNG